MEIYYIANSIYQFAYALPLYKKCKGTFIVHNKKKLKHFQEYLHGFIANDSSKQQLPEVNLIPKNEIHKLNAILVFFANSIDPDQDFSTSITCFYEHGTSDKRYEGGNSIATKKLKKYDFILLSGPKNKHRLLDTNVTKDKSSLIEVGCLRFDDYLQHKFTREKTENLLNIKDKSRKNILYAPTWKFGNGTFKAYASHLIEELTDEYNLILRPHYHDRRYGNFIYWLSKLKGKKHVYFSKPQDVLKHDTYAAFAASDLLISDISSVIYEYLITNKPMVLIDNDFEQRHIMPKEIDILPHVDVYKKGDNLKQIINRNLKEKQTKKYRQLLDQCFYKTKGGSVEYLTQFLTQLKNK